MSTDNADAIKTINSSEYLRQLIALGYALIGPRKEAPKDLSMIEKYFDKGYEFVPEQSLLRRGYQIVPPSTFSKGLQFAYKTTEDKLDKYYRSNYSLKRRSETIPLYLKYEGKD